MILESRSLQLFFMQGVIKKCLVLQERLGDFNSKDQLCVILRKELQLTQIEKKELLFLNEGIP